MKKALAKSKSQSRKSGEPATEAVREATLEEIVGLTGKDPLIALAEVACGKLACTVCNGVGHIKRAGFAQTCARCQGTRRETVPASAMLNARHKLAAFFYGPRKAEETGEPEDEPPQRSLTVRFVGRHGDQEPERG
ncbi:MAG TPA: hypothetical protein VIY49_06750 [Bryobacteraceae bacterium]